MYHKHARLSRFRSLRKMHSEAGSYTPVPAPSDSVPICYDQCRPAGTFRDFSDRHPADIWSGKRINRKTGVGKMAHRPHTLRGTPDKTNRRMKSPNQSVSPSVFPSSQSRTIESTCGPYLAMKTFPIPFMSDNSFSLRGSTRHTVTRAICCMIT